MHFKKTINQGSFYFQGLRSFKDTLPKNIKKILNKKGFVFADIVNQWKYLVGKNIFNICYPKSFKPNNKQTAGTLIINVKRGNEIDVEYNKSEIINKINSYFGYKVIDKIRLEKFNTKIVSKKNIYISDASKSRYLKSINNIKNEKLKKSLI